MVNFLEMKAQFNGKVPSLVVLFGEDKWVIHRALNDIENMLNLQFEDFNATYTSTQDINEVLNACNTMPFGDDYRLVVADNLVKKGTDNKPTKVDKNLIKLLSEYASTMGTGRLVVLLEGFSRDELSAVSGHEAVNCNKLPTKGICDWLGAYCRRNGCNIERSASELLARYCMSDMARINSEIDKLIDYAKDNITEDIVERLVEQDIEDKVLDLTKLIATKQSDKAIGMTKRLIRGSKDKSIVRSLFSLMYNYYRRMYYIRIDSASNNNELADKLNVKPAAIGYIRDVAMKYNARQLLSAIEMFSNADQKIKSFNDEEGSLVLLVLQLVNIK